MNAYDIAGTLADLDVTIADLGCVMLDVDPIDVRIFMRDEWEYKSADPDLKHVNGFDAGNHVTLKFGLLTPTRIRAAVDQVLQGWTPEPLTVAYVTYFPSPRPETEPYACIVAKLTVTANLRDAHQRLSLLPHIDTHPTYQPHLTLGYVRRENALAAVKAAGEVIHEHYAIDPLTINYGDLI